MGDNTRPKPSTNDAEGGRSANFPPAVVVRKVEVTPRADRLHFLIRLADYHGEEDCVCGLSRDLMQELREQVDAALMIPASR